jgi:hypothetical protein
MFDNLKQRQEFLETQGYRFELHGHTWFVRYEGRRHRWRGYQWTDNHYDSIIETISQHYLNDAVLPRLRGESNGLG